ncbi:RING zinc finger protein, putative [Plasmodium ovale wallikeri]|uniref:RING zinc finger protein, putative n=1 Tax=Plasmodium ovale wallikeri TaxID=864142 RepID=A0A1A8YUJ8_PLAOA|nr:RING zinc finger protein, putative [Plasmodium ovale wallikeri]SBT35757.1 RING zinc finger protein, putative [Plasmodium ovale wallikeri]
MGEHLEGRATARDSSRSGDATSDPNAYEDASEISNIYEDAKEGEIENDNVSACTNGNAATVQRNEEELNSTLRHRFHKGNNYKENSSNGCNNVSSDGNNGCEQIPSDVECAICMKLLIIPVTIPCGHNFCRDCLEKAKEYKNACPLCRSNMGDKKNINILLGELIKEKYPITYAKRIEEIEIIKREREKKILKERIDAIKNSSVIPLFKVPETFGPYFPGETFQLIIYNKKFIDLIDLISSERTFAITSTKGRKYAEDDKLYGIHVKILEQNMNNQVFHIKCVANFRVLLYNVIHFHQYDNYIASHSPLFDEAVRVNLLEYSLVGAVPPISGRNCVGSCTGSCTGNCIGNRGEGKEQVEALKSLLSKIEQEDDINSISTYYEQYRKIINNTEGINTREYSSMYSVVNYYSCVIFSRICLLCIKYQLNRFGNTGIRLFNNKFKNIRLTSSEPSNEELEKFSYSLSSAVISRSILKWTWFKTTNTSERLESITQYFVKKKNKSILALDNSRSPIIHRLFMLDSISSSLLILIFMLLIVFVKYFLY